MFRSLLLVISIFCGATFSYSQCCGQGTQMGGVGNLGVLKKRDFQVVLFHKYSSSVNQTADNAYLILDANYNFIGTSISYGLTNKMTIETELGYFINKSQRYKLNPIYTIKAFGLTNGVISLKHTIYKTTAPNWEIVGGLGFKFPFTTNYQLVDGVQLPIDNQTSTCAFGIVPKILVFKKFPKMDATILFLHRPDINFKNNYDYTYGSGFTSALFFSKQFNFISKGTTGVLQIRNDIRLRDVKTDGELAETTGSNVLFISPQIGQVFLKNYFISFAYDFPVYQHFNTEKLKYKHAFTFSLVANFPSRKNTQKEIDTIDFVNESDNLQDTTFTVYGNCTMCKESIEQTLSKQKGIESATWNVETKQLTVKYDSEKISVEKIKIKLAEIGYDTDTHRASDKAYDALHGCCKYQRP